MVTLVLNPGSNSLKFDAIEADGSQRSPSAGRRLVSGSVEDLGKKTVLVCGRNREGLQADSYTQAAGHALAALRKALGEDFRPELVAYRVVHGGDQFRMPVRINTHVMAAIERWGEAAPLHNAAALELIRCVQKAFKGVPGVAVFDTSFHCGIPRTAYTYGLPLDLSSELRIRRYGFHGISHRYQLLRYAELNQISIDEVKLVTLHLESGSSAAAIRNGRSVDTSMGFTPLEGLVMGSRCGDLDPAIPPYIARKRRMSLDQVEHLLNHDSGLLGISGISNDTRVLVEHLGEERARLALEVFSYRVRKYVGAYLAVLGGADAVIFSGGIGENTPFVRSFACDRFEWCGLDLDEELNSTVMKGDVRISRPDSQIHVWAIHADEALMIAHEAVNGQGAIP